MASPSAPSGTSPKAVRAEREYMTRILLVGTELPLLEGLSQSLASSGFTPVVAQTLSEAREIAAQDAPLVVIVSRALAAAASADPCTTRSLLRS